MDALHALTLGDVLREHGRSRPGQLAVVDGATRLTYRQLDERVDRAAHALSHVGVEAGERVLWLGQNSARLLELVLASARLGAMCCPANWRQSPDELAFVVDDLDPQVVVWQEEEVGDRVRAARDGGAGRDATWLCHDARGGCDAPGDDEYDAFVAGGEPGVVAPDVDPAVPLLALYTAAFDGRPHAAMLSHTALVGQGLLFGRYAEIDDTSVLLASGPLFHVAQWWWTLAALLHGGATVFSRRVDPEELCRLVEAERVTGAYLVGPTFDGILAANRDGRYDLSSLRTHPGRPEWDAMTSRDTSAWGRAPGGYGQTELVGMLTFTLLAPGAAGAHGRPSPLAQVRIVDPDGHDVPAGETGEIVARGPLVMHGYWNRPEETARRFRGGWHHTRDLGRREADGSITFVGPAARMIKSAAENIYPVEVERCIAAHPAVAECAVIGVPDPRWTQRVTAIVVVADGRSVTSDEIVEHCRAHIASYKKPRSVEFVDALPRAGLAVDYDALDARFGGGGYPGGRNRSA